MSVVSCVEVPAPVGALLGRYREYLIVERGLRPTTVATYVWNARLFLLAACGDDGDRIETLTAGDVARFVIAVSDGRRASSVNTIVVSVRALLRYFYAVGLIATPLAQATPWLARGRVLTLPRTTVPGAAMNRRLGFVGGSRSLSGWESRAVRFTRRSGVLIVYVFGAQRRSTALVTPLRVT